MNLSIKFSFRANNDCQDNGTDRHKGYAFVSPTNEHIGYIFFTRIDIHRTHSFFTRIHRYRNHASFSTKSTHRRPCLLHWQLQAQKPRRSIGHHFNKCYFILKVVWRYHNWLRDLLHWDWQVRKVKIKNKNTSEREKNKVIIQTCQKMLSIVLPRKPSLVSDERSLGPSIVTNSSKSTCPSPAEARKTCVWQPTSFPLTIQATHIKIYNVIIIIKIARVRQSFARAFTVA